MLPSYYHFRMGLSIPDCACAGFDCTHCLLETGPCHSDPPCRLRRRDHLDLYLQPNLWLYHTERNSFHCAFTQHPDVNFQQDIRVHKGSIDFFRFASGSPCRPSEALDLFPFFDTVSPLIALRLDVLHVPSDICGDTVPGFEIEFSSRTSPDLHHLHRGSVLEIKRPVIGKKIPIGPHVDQSRRWESLGPDTFTAFIANNNQEKIASILSIDPNTDPASIQSLAVSLNNPHVKLHPENRIEAESVCPFTSKHSLKIQTVCFGNTVVELKIWFIEPPVAGYHFKRKFQIPNRPNQNPPVSLGSRRPGFGPGLLGARPSNGLGLLGARPPHFNRPQQQGVPRRFPQTNGPSFLLPLKARKNYFIQNSIGQPGLLQVFQKGILFYTIDKTIVHYPLKLDDFGPLPPAAFEHNYLFRDQCIQIGGFKVYSIDLPLEDKNLALIKASFYSTPAPKDSDFYLPGKVLCQNRSLKVCKTTRNIHHAELRPKSALSSIKADAEFVSCVEPKGFVSFNFVPALISALDAASSQQQLQNLLHFLLNKKHNFESMGAVFTNIHTQPSNFAAA